MAGISFVVAQGGVPDEVYDTVMDQLLDFIISITPVDTGALAAAWERNGDTIQNDLDYAEYIEDGWSDQAPDGMIGPAMEELPDLVDAAMADYNAQNYNPDGDY